MNSIIKMMPKFITYYIVLQTLYNLAKFKEDDVMINTYNSSQSISINVTSQLELQDDLQFLIESTRCLYSIFLQGKTRRCLS